MSTTTIPANTGRTPHGEIDLSPLDDGDAVGGYAERGDCALCGDPFEHFGNSPEPLGRFDQRVCDRCNGSFVLTTRLGGFTPAQVRALASLLRR